MSRPRPRTTSDAGCIRADAIYSIAGVAARLRLGSRGWARLRDELRIPVHRIGNLRIVRGADVVAAVERMAEEHSMPTSIPGAGTVGPMVAERD